MLNNTSTVAIDCIIIIPSDCIESLLLVTAFHILFSFFHDVYCSGKKLKWPPRVTARRSY